MASGLKPVCFEKYGNFAWPRLSVNAYKRQNIIFNILCSTKTRFYIRQWCYTLSDTCFDTILTLTIGYTLIPVLQTRHRQRGLRISSKSLDFTADLFCLVMCAEFIASPLWFSKGRLQRPTRYVHLAIRKRLNLQVFEHSSALYCLITRARNVLGLPCHIHPLILESKQIKSRVWFSYLVPDLSPISSGLLWTVFPVSTGVVLLVLVVFAGPVVPASFCASWSLSLFPQPEDGSHAHLVWSAASAANKLHVSDVHQLRDRPSWASPAARSTNQNNCSKEGRGTRLSLQILKSFHFKWWTAYIRRDIVFSVKWVKQVLQSVIIL